MNNYFKRSLELYKKNVLLRHFSEIQRRYGSATAEEMAKASVYFYACLNTAGIDPEENPELVQELFACAKRNMLEVLQASAVAARSLKMTEALED